MDKKYREEFCNLCQLKMFKSQLYQQVREYATLEEYTNHLIHHCVSNNNSNLKAMQQMIHVDDNMCKNNIYKNIKNIQ
jgi:hypothetical protein